MLKNNPALKKWYENWQKECYCEAKPFLNPSGVLNAEVSPDGHGIDKNKDRKNEGNKKLNSTEDEKFVANITAPDAERKTAASNVKIVEPKRTF